MPKIKTNAEVAAHLTQAYVEWLNGGEPDPMILHIQAMKEKLAADEQKPGRRPVNFLVMKQRFEMLDNGLREAAEYIRAGQVDPKELGKKQKKLANTVAGLASTHREVQESLDNPEDVDHETMQECFNGYDLKSFLQIEPTKAPGILKASGETKSAYKWIESAYKGMDSPVNVSEERVARILAARQLGNAVYDHPENIKNTMISEAELNNHAQKLMRSPEFQEYFKTIGDLDFKKTIKHGHGGYLEKTFEDFLKAQNIKEPLEFDAHGRYQKAMQADPGRRDISTLYDYRNYEDYFEKSKGKVITSKEVHAARMAAADHLKRKNPEAPFSKRELDAQARKFMKDPSFKMLMAMPGTADRLVSGDAPGFAQSAQDLKNNCAAMLDKNGHFAHAGHSDIALERLQKRVDENPDLQPVVDSLTALKQGKKTPEDVIGAVGTILAYQEKHMGDGHGPMGKDMNDTLRVLHEITNGTPLHGMVETQIEKTNAARGVQPGFGPYVTMERLAKEGLEAEAKKVQAEAAKGNGIGVPMA